MYQQFLCRRETGVGVPDDVRVLLAGLEFEKSPRTLTFPALSRDEIRSARRFCDERDAVRFAATRSMLRAHLAREVGFSDSDLDFSRSAMGRPFLSNCPGSTIDFNVSHSGAFALVAWSHCRRVGVDIEQCSASLNWETLQDRVLGESDRAAFSALPHQKRRDQFFDVWVANEAFLKAHGSVGAGLADFSVLWPGVLSR
ncbi:MULTISPECIES: 4'-phosphopantetheinyl transferase family protein [unclassified Paraburkholderia]|uniref:4'-phosphopantetheinyl transferase family protein n=1 Tax=unclassified Paraburkholderia TaxID=2615204 RepID=UPI0034CF4EB7